MSSPSTVRREEASKPQPARKEGQLDPYADFIDYLRRYSREKPEAVAWTCLGIGFLLGWKLKPW